MSGSINIYSLSSGSSGNCILIKTRNAAILMDCGVTGKAAEREIKEAGILPEQLDAIIVTHEHIDHISGVGVMCRRYKIPVYATIGTWKAMINSIGRIDPALVHYIAAEVPFKIKETVVTPFKTSHDAAESIGAVFCSDSEHCGVATDLGTVTRHIFDLLLPCASVMIEANHDEHMLINGAYPQPLKERILSDAGHLSNRVCGAMCARLAREGALRNIILGHLSSDNNTPAAAYNAVKESLTREGFTVGKDIFLTVANRNCITKAEYGCEYKCNQCG